MGWARQLPVLLPLAAAWATAQSARILAEGAPLSAEQCALAQRVGVRHPDAVRVLCVPAIPAPDHPALAAVCNALGFLGPDTAGLTLGAGIFIREDLAGQRRLCAHELRHVAQYEEYPTIAAYLDRYISELLEHGYAHSPFEIDARRMESVAG